jgi:hypothetical protein
MVNVIQMYARRDRTVTSHEELPVSYYDKEVFKETVERYRENLDNYFGGKEVILSRLKKEQTYTLETEVSIPSYVLFNVRSVHSIVRESESPLVEKINLTNGGQIEIRVGKEQVDVSSKRYGKSQPSYQISKKLATGLNPYQALADAENSIKHRLAVIEQMRREREMHNGLVSYQKKQEDSKKRQWNQIFEQIGGGIDPEIMAAIHEMEIEKKAA